MTYAEMADSYKNKIVICPICGQLLEDKTPHSKKGTYDCDCYEYFVKELKQPLILPVMRRVFNKACFGCRDFEKCGDVDREYPCKYYRK